MALKNFESMIRVMAKSLGLIAVGGCFVALTARAADYTLTAPGTSAHIDADSGAGMNNWTVGTQNQLAKQWFLFRVGNGLAQPINAIGPSALLFNNANTLVLGYTSPQFSLTVSYTLTGGGMGAGSADILETVVVNNLSAAPLDFHFFQYSDFNLLGTPGGDQVEFLSTSSVVQTEGVFGIQEGIIQPPSSFREAAIAGPGGTENKLLTIPGYNLNNASGPLVGDVTWAFQWDSLIGVGQSLEIYKDKTLIVPVIPEPSVVALVGIGVGLLLRRRILK
jgi:hypothetical protein